MALYSPYFTRWKMKTRKIESCVVPPLSLQEEFASYRGQAGVVSSLSRHRVPARGGCRRARGRRRVELVETSRGCLNLYCMRRSMLKTPSARFAGTSPKSDDSNSESFCKCFIVVFGGGRVGAGVVVIARRAYRDIEGWFESLLAESFDGGR